MQTIYIIHSGESIISNRLQYIADFLSNHPAGRARVIAGTQVVPPENCITVGYAVTGANYYVPSSEFMHQISGWVDGRSVSLVPFVAGDRTVYEVRKGAASSPVRDFVADHTFAFDVFTTLFFFLSLCQDFRAPVTATDIHGRTKESFNVLVRHGKHHQPVVDHLVEAFFDALGVSSDTAPTVITWTHDIDMLYQFPTVYRWVRTLGRTILKDRNIQRFSRTIRTGINLLRGQQRDPFDTFSWLLCIPGFNEYQIYFLLGGDTPYDGFYRPDDPKVPTILAQAEENNYRIGIHPSYASYQSAAIISSERAILERLLNKEVSISRQHWLRFQIPDTLVALHRAGIKRDASYGFANTYGFRAGTGFPFVPYNLAEEQPYAICLDPLVVMDVGLLRQAKFRVNEASEQLRRFVQSNRLNTRISFNFHNSIFDDTLLDAAAFQRMCYEIPNWLNGK